MILVVVGLALGAPGVGWYFWKAHRASPARAEPASIAVLPFKDLSPAKDQDWMCDGIAEEIIDAFCTITGLRVAARSSSLRGQDLNLRPSGYEAAQAGMQTSSAASNPSGSLDVLTEHPVPPIEPKSTEHKNFGQPVVSVSPSFDDTEHRPLTPAEAAKRFQIPEYLLRRACAEGALEHLRVVNSLWLAPTAVEEFACAWRARKTRNQDH